MDFMKSHAVKPLARHGGDRPRVKQAEQSLLSHLPVPARGHKQENYLLGGRMERVYPTPHSFPMQAEGVLTTNPSTLSTVDHRRRTADAICHCHISLSAGVLVSRAHGLPRGYRLHVQCHILRRGITICCDTSSNYSTENNRGHASVSSHS